MPAPKDVNCDPDRIPPSNLYRSAIAPFEDGGYMKKEWDLLDSADIASLEKSTGKLIFVVGCVYYEGLDHQPYYSDICATWAANSPRAIACTDIDRNFIR